MPTTEPQINLESLCDMGLEFGSTMIEQPRRRFLDAVTVEPIIGVIRFYDPTTDSSGFEEVHGIDPEATTEDAAQQVCRWFQQKHPELICWIGPRPPAPCPIVKP